MAYGTQRFNAAVTRAPVILSCAELIQFLTLIPISLRSILLVSYHLRLDLPKGLFPAGVPVKILKVLLPSSILATSQSSRLNHPDYIMLCERYKL